MIKGLFFDLDGTLVNTYEADYLAYRDAIRQVGGVDISQADFNETHGIEMAGKMRMLVPELPESDYDAVRAAKKKFYRDYVSITTPNEALVRFLAQFTEHQHCLLVTSAKRDNAMSVLEHHGLTGLFDGIICGEDTDKPKPDPAPYLLALEKSGLAASEVLAFEDSATGIASAEAAGIAVIQVKEFAS